MASPTAAGNALLVLQYFAEGWYPSGTKRAADAFSPSGALIKALLMTSGEAMDFTTLTDGSQISTGGYPSNKQGYGRIQLSNVLNFASSSADGISLFVRGAALSSSPMYVAIGSKAQKHNYTFTTSLDEAQSPIRITLSYSDDPGTVGGKVVVNDLSIDVRGGGEDFLPLNRFDRNINNVEMVVINTPVSNTTYTVTVYAEDLSSVQPYALGI